jgi:hypothetical protein
MVVRGALVAGLGLLGACAGTGASANRDAQVLTVAGPVPAEGASGSANGADRPRYVVPDEVLHNPGDRAMLMFQLARQTMRKVQDIPEPTYQARVRPQLARELRAAGFDEQDANLVLADLDRDRAARSAR